MPEPQIYEDAITRWGIDPQLNQACQELLELALALTADRLDMDNLTEEVADNEIMFRELKIIYKNKAAVEAAKETLPITTHSTREAIHALVNTAFLITKNKQHRFSGSEGTKKGLNTVVNLTRAMALSEHIFDELRERPGFADMIATWHTTKINRLSERLYTGQEIDGTHREGVTP